MRTQIQTNNSNNKNNTIKQQILGLHNLEYSNIRYFECTCKHACLTSISSLICVSSLLLQIAMRLCRIGKNCVHGICARKRNKRKEFVFNGYTALSVRFMTKNRLKGRDSHSRPLKCVFFMSFLF